MSYKTKLSQTYSTSSEINRKNKSIFTSLLLIVFWSTLFLILTKKTTHIYIFFSLVKKLCSDRKFKKKKAVPRQFATESFLSYDIY